MKLFFLRHGKAGQFGDPAYPDDSQRPLTKEGMAQLKSQAKALRRLSVSPDVIWTSPLVRARQTAEIVAEELGGRQRLIESELLRPGARLDLLDRLLVGEARAYSAVMFVGHEPDFSSIVGQLIARPGAAIEMKKAGLALVETEPPLVLGGGTLVWLLPPKVLL